MNVFCTKGKKVYSCDQLCDVMANSRGGISSSSSSSSLEELEQEATRISSIDSLRDNAKNFKDREQQRTGYKINFIYISICVVIISN